MKYLFLTCILFVSSFSINAQSKVNPLDLRTAKKSNGKPQISNQSSTIDGSKLMVTKPKVNPLQLTDFNTLDVNISIENTKRSSIVNVSQAKEEAFKVLNSNSTQISHSYNANNNVILQSVQDELGYYHIKFQQTHNNVPVYGSELWVHINTNESIVNGKYMEISNLSTQAKFSDKQAIETAKTTIHCEMGNHELTESQKKILNYEQPIAQLIIYLVDGIPTLCYDIESRPNFIERWRTIVNANTNQIVESYNHTCHIDGPKVGSGTDLNGTSRTVNSYQIGSTYYLIDASKSMYNSSNSSLPDNPAGAIWTLDAGNTPAEDFNHVTSSTQNFSNSKGVSAHYNAGFAFDYYKTTFNRNSINGKGGNIISVINVSADNGLGFDNAYWNGQFMAYGNGLTTFKPLAGALDVAGHEMTHGVVENSAGLEYKGQSGAINESMADIFGCMMDRNDWLLGEDIMKPGFNSNNALRNLQDPHNGGTRLGDNGYQPKKMSEYYTGSQDNYGVHINSGIPNHAFYLFATNIGKDKAEQVFYRALTLYLTKTSQFKDLRLAVVQAATDLYGTTEAQAAATAFDAVGIYGPPVSGGGSGTIGNNVADLPVNPGQSHILYYDLDPAISTTLTKYNTVTASLQGQITRSLKKRPSVVDNGSYCVYVGSDGRIYKLLLDGSKTETILQNDPDWDNVAISKDGKRLAAVSNLVDTSIYVYDFAKAEWKTFKLYNPTYSNINSGGALYADAIEFDHTGTKIMYDSKNFINNQSGTDYTYWDVGIIDVFSLETNNWNNGKIEKLFSSLPEGVSIGNPTFSQRSPYIVAYDYINSNTGNYLVTGYNLNTNKSGIIFSGTDLGYPSFSKNDDLIVFNAFDVNNNKIVAIKALATDKITGTGSASVYVNLAKWGVFYANGTRPLLFSSKELLTFGFQALSPVVNGVFNGTNVTCNLPSSVEKTNLVSEFTNSPYSYVKIQNNVQTSGVSYNDYTTPVTYTVVAQDGSTQNYIITVTGGFVNVNKMESNKSIVYPNPNNGLVKMTGIEEGELIELYNSEGKLISLFNYKSQGVDIQNLNDGVYQLAYTHNGIKMHTKLILQR